MTGSAYGGPKGVPSRGFAFDLAGVEMDADAEARIDLEGVDAPSPGDPAYCAVGVGCAGDRVVLRCRGDCELFGFDAVEIDRAIAWAAARSPTVVRYSARPFDCQVRPERIADWCTAVFSAVFYPMRTSLDFELEEGAVGVLFEAGRAKLVHDGEIEDFGLSAGEALRARSWTRAREFERFQRPANDPESAGVSAADAEAWLLIVTGPVRSEEFATVEQRRPTTGEGDPVFLDLCADVRARAEIGRRRYGDHLRPGNGRDGIVDAYQEVLDLAMYLRQVLTEREFAQATEVQGVQQVERPKGNGDCGFDGCSRTPVAWSCPLAAPGFSVPVRLPVCDHHVFETGTIA